MIVDQALSLIMELVNRLTKNKNMSTTDIKERILVWTKTERAGDVVTVDRTEGEYTYFTDGTFCYTNIIGEEFFMEAKTMAQAESMAVPFRGPEAIQATSVAVTPKTTAPSASTGEINVMLEMLKKISAKNTISMPLELNVPSKEVYDLFKDQMDITKADLNEQILLLVQSQIDNLQEQLKPQAEEFIKLYYNGRTKQPNTRTQSKSTGASPKQAPGIEY